MNHWLIFPVLIPAMVASFLSFAARRDIVLARVFSIGSSVLLVFLGCFQLATAADGTTHTYELGNWPAPFGIVLVLDRLAAIMLLLTAILGLLVLLYAINGCDREGTHFHPLFQFQLMGINGAFLTGDLFNLYVFFEILLIASYGLTVHGGGAVRLRAGVQYVVINLVGSSLFLFALGLLYGTTGTLNMAHMATKVPGLAEGDAALFFCGAALLLVVFGIKSAMVPFHFWLPGTYTNASGPVVALFSIMTKVGAYAIVRVFILIFGEYAGPSGWFAGHWLMPIAGLTLTLGMLGVVAARSLGQQASFMALASMGTVMIAIAGFTPSTISSAIYYLIHSTLAIAALFLVADAVRLRRPGYGDTLTETPAFENRGLLGAVFFLVAIAVIGLPPLSGFIGKLLILKATFGLGAWPWIWLLMLGTTLLCLIGFAGSGSQTFWKSTASESGQAPIASTPLVLPMVSVGGLIASLMLLTAFSQPITLYLDATAVQLFAPENYVQAVLGSSTE